MKKISRLVLAALLISILGASAAILSAQSGAGVELFALLDTDSSTTVSCTSKRGTAAARPIFSYKAPKGKRLKGYLLLKGGAQ